MPMSPGTYLRQRREAAGLSLEAVALDVGTDPAWPAHERAAWLQLIEADGAPIGDDVIRALVRVKPFMFSPTVLLCLDAIHRGEQRDAPQICRGCGCTWTDPCIDAAGVCCAWVADDPTLCTSCSPWTPAAEALLTPTNDAAPAASEVAA